LRRDVLSKLLVNVALNPISALTRLGTHDLCVDPSLRGVMLSVMHETLAVSKACGYDLSGQVDLEQAIDPQARARTHRASMLQDALQGRAMETEAILGQVADFGRQHDVATPSIDIVLALLRGLDRSFRR
jgi:2-dehydropantoate 2-reductase